jgi:hypothetical protein
MTSEELDKAIEFLLKQSADFWAGMEESKREDDELRRGIEEFKEQTARFEIWAADVVGIQPERSDRLDKQAEEQKRVNDEISRRVDLLIARVDLIIDRLFPSGN